VACADESGSYWEEPGWQAAVRSGTRYRLPDEAELSELPAGSVLHYLPGRGPLGWMRGGDARRSPPEEVDCALALAAQLPSGWTRTLIPAYRRHPGAPDLPFFGYAAVVFRQGRLYAAAVRTEDNPRWNPQRYSRHDLEARIDRMLARYPGNRLYQHLEKCALDYGCYNAQNVFFGRWEAAVAVSAGCNSHCRGCISQQPEGMPPSPQERLDFLPTVEEIVEVALEHLRHPDAILSFGQGCEGEPLLQADLIARAIGAIRARTDRGTLHLNTNGSRPRGLRKLLAAGLDSVRVSLNSVVPERYAAYYRPRGYRFSDLEESIRTARGEGAWVSLNLLCMPGVNDSEEEVQGLLDFARRLDVNMIQIRNLNIDPDLFFASVPEPRGPVLGVPAMLRTLRKELPGVRIGSHNPPVRRSP
jgi:pyruvate-formate lyase-activating enzyme